MNTDDSHNNQTVFVEQASKAVESSPIKVGNEQAGALLARAREMIYHWPIDFKGFSADFLFSEKQGSKPGKITVHSSRKYSLSVEWEDVPAETRDWVRFQLEELISHREAPEKSRIASKTGVEFGDTCAIYGPKLIFLGDKMGSFYRVKDQKITQISRGYGGQRFTIIIDRHVDCEGLFAAGSYQAYYFEAGEGKLIKAESYQDDYTHVSGVFLPTERRFTEATSSSGTVNRVISFSNHTLIVD